MNYLDALRENIPPSKRARVINDGRTVYIHVLVSKTIVPPGYVALNDKAVSIVGLLLELAGKSEKGMSEA